MNNADIEFAALVKALADYLDKIQERDAIKALEQTRALMVGLEASTPDLAMSARIQRRRWSEIGAALGISKQAAHNRFRHVDHEIEELRAQLLRENQEAARQQSERQQEDHQDAATPTDADSQRELTTPTLPRPQVVSDAEQEEMRECMRELRRRRPSKISEETAQRMEEIAERKARTAQQTRELMDAASRKRPADDEV